MKEVISRDAALAALKEYNHEPFHIQHALTAAGQDTLIAVSDHYILVKSFRAGSSCKLSHFT